MSTKRTKRADVILHPEIGVRYSRETFQMVIRVEKDAKIEEVVGGGGKFEEVEFRSVDSLLVCEGKGDILGAIAGDAYTGGVHDVIGDVVSDSDVNCKTVRAWVYNLQTDVGRLV